MNRRRRRPVEEFDVVGSGAMDRIEVRRGQHDAPPLPPRRVPTRAQRRAYLPTILALLAADASRWWTYAALQQASGYAEGVVKDVVRRLRRDGQVDADLLPETPEGVSYRIVRFKAS